MSPALRTRVLPATILVIGGLITPLCAEAPAESFHEEIRTLLGRFCFDCHSAVASEGNVNLEAMTEAIDLARGFKSWEKVAQMVRERKMPPPDAQAPTDDERALIAALIDGALERYIAEHAGDPGPIVLRRLTSAEYYYTICDLTGLDLPHLVELFPDAAAGEGFTNTGTGQFMQDSTLERYLESAKQISEHAVIGAGPLEFFPDAGETGRELSAITRIARIYREHGFRTSAGEGAEPFGLDLYPRALFVAWQYRYRDELSYPQVSLAELARREQVSERFCEYVWNVLSRETLRFPLSMIAERWRAIDSPGVQPPEAAREACESLSDELRQWQSALAASANDEEEASVLTAGSIDVATERSLTATIDWEKSAATGRIELSVLPASRLPIDRTAVLWKNARLRFRLDDGRRLPPQPLRQIVTDESAARFAFGRRTERVPVEPNDFVTLGELDQTLTFKIPARAISARLTLDVRLLNDAQTSGIVRCNVSDGYVEGETAAEVGGSSALLADPEHPAVTAWKQDVSEFARTFPEVSHREPAPSDRDPIPPPYDNAYNRPERNHFHTAIKYHRDDAFFVDYIADDRTRRQLDQAWVDLLTSFDYHAANMRFLAEKYSLDLDDRQIALLDPASFDRLPEEPRAYAQRWANELAGMRQALRDAESGHVDDALRLAARAWRRPLDVEEQARLRSFYDKLRSDSELDHPRAIRILLSRILVAPAFLYRLESPGRSHGVGPLNDWQLAARLSYFLWSSAPDEDLLRAADEGRLSDPAELERHARRMLRDPKARRLAAEFFGQWLGFYRFDTYRGIDTSRFPEFTAELQAAMYEESLQFFEHIVHNDRPVDEILFADYSFVNRRLADHYGIDFDHQVGNEFRQVAGMGRYDRGGLLGLGAVLTATSAPLRTSPVKRGDWVLRRIVGTPVPPPPADAGSIPADEAQADGLTLRRRLEAHRDQASCVGCHSRIDPLGFALENFDAIGRWRDSYLDGQSIDTADTMADGTVIDGPDGLRTYLRRERAAFYRTMSIKLLGYALGRSELASDRPLVEQLTDKLSGEGSVADLVAGIVTSKQFMTFSERPPLP